MKLRIFEAFAGQATIPYTVLALDVVDAINTLKLCGAIKFSIEIHRIQETARPVKFVSENIKRKWREENESKTKM